MVFRLESNRAAFESKLNTLAQAVQKSSGLLINENLQVIKKNGFCWRILCLLNPFFTLFGVDIFSHVRIYKVASNILQYCEANKRFFYEDANLLEEIKSKILTPLDNRTNRIHHDFFKRVMGDLDRCQLPEPKIAIPPLAINASSFTLEKWYWPRDLSILGVTVQQKETIDQALKVINTHQRSDLPVNIQFEGRALIIKKGTQVISLDLPYKIFTLSLGNVFQIVLVTKKIIGCGGQRKVKLCLNLTTGKYFAKKKLAHDCEAQFVQLISQYVVQGLPFCFLRKRKNKSEVLEQLYDGTLAILFGTVVLSNLKQKLSLIHDVLHGLKFLHNTFFDEISYKSPGRDIEFTSIKNLKIFHFDLNPSNIVVRKGKDNIWEAVIIDFGCVGIITVRGGTLGYKAPEEVNLLCKINPYNSTEIANIEPVVQHNIKYGQAMDIWSMGLIVAIILTGGTSNRISRANIPPLRCIEESLINSQRSIYKDESLGNLTQGQINNDLAELKDKSQSLKANENGVVNKVWDLVGKMLQINPDNRITAENALIEFQNAIASLN